MAFGSDRRAIAAARLSRVPVVLDGYVACAAAAAVAVFSAGFALYSLIAPALGEVYAAGIVGAVAVRKIVQR